MIDVQLMYMNLFCHSFGCLLKRLLVWLCYLKKNPEKTGGKSYICMADANSIAHIKQSMVYVMFFNVQ